MPELIGCCAGCLTSFIGFNALKLIPIIGPARKAAKRINSFATAAKSAPKSDKKKVKVNDVENAAKSVSQVISSVKDFI